MTVGENIKAYRKKQGLTQKQLGDRCNLSEAMIRQYELGIRNPKIETIRKIANGLNICMNALLEDSWAEYVDLITEDFVLSSQDETIKQIIQHIDAIGYLFRADSKGNAWIEYPDGTATDITNTELVALKDETDNYLKFRLDELRKKKH